MPGTLGCITKKSMNLKNSKMKLSKFIVILFIGLLYSCVSIKKYDGTDLKPINKIKEIDGEYYNNAIKNGHLTHHTIKNRIDFRSKLKDTSKIKTVRIEVLDEKNSIHI